MVYGLVYTLVVVVSIAIDSCLSVRSIPRILFVFYDMAGLLIDLSVR